MQTVQYNLGIPVNDYVVVDFNAFIRLVDLIGGIDVNVERAIYDPTYPDMNYGYDPFYLNPGMQHLDGVTALKYARSRHGSDDIDRAARQQQVLYAIRDKLVSLDMIPQLALQAPLLWAEYAQSVDTGLALDQDSGAGAVFADHPQGELHQRCWGGSTLAGQLARDGDSRAQPPTDRPVDAGDLRPGYNQ